MNAQDKWNDKPCDSVDTWRSPGSDSVKWATGHVDVGNTWKPGY